ncbi:MAG: motility associated factor glycosyltransferase family protein [Fretibacterium sp.]|nr:motility associated factor glycosyltransferase family protein [Fretibacterium sp.]
MSMVTLPPQSSLVWDANMKELRRLQPLLAARLEEWVEEHGRSFERDELETAHGTWISGLTEKPFFQPSELPKKPWRRGEEGKVSVLFFYGVGTAPWFFRMVRTMPKTVLSLVVFEPELSLLALLLHMTHVYLALPKGCLLSFITFPETNLMTEALAVNIGPMGIYAASLAIPWSHPGEVEVLQEEFEELQEKLRETITVRLQMLGNSAEDTLLGIRQIALNAPWILFGPSLQTIAEDFRGRPFIWVASGPSLDKNVHLLKENRDRAVIVCADTAVRKLLGLGIQPHIAVSLERVLDVYDYMERTWVEFPEETKKILYISQSVCVPELVKWPGPHVIVGKKELPIDQWINQGLLHGDMLHSGLSVAHMGLWLASGMGASSLALIGQDLAFAEDGSSHAAVTISEEHREEEKARGQTGGLELPGALSDTVRTTEIWLLFLRLIEQYIPLLGVPVFDCTEGGARIEGTTLKTLEDWMEDSLSSVEPFGSSPAELLIDRPRTSEERETLTVQATQRLDAALQELDRSRATLEELREGVDKVSAPALAPTQRREYAAVLSRQLDEYHHTNPVIEFIGQSQTTLNAVGITKTRLLEDAIAVKEWRRVHLEILEGHGKALNFLKSWIGYIKMALNSVNRFWDEGCSLAPLSFHPSGSFQEGSGPNDGESTLQLLQSQLDDIDTAQTLEEELSAHALFDNLLARADHKWWSRWDRRIDWKIALVLEREGRNAEAVRFMKRMETESLEVWGLPHEAGVQFLKDYARIASGYDLCFFPDYRLARTCAQHVIELEPDDLEARELLKEINQKALDYYRSFAPWEFAEKKFLRGVFLDWTLARAEAEQALSEGDLMLTFERVWALIKEYAPFIPDGARAYLDWLTTQIARVEEQQPLPVRLEEIKQEVLEWIPLFEKLGIREEQDPGSQSELSQEEILMSGRSTADDMDKGGDKEEEATHRKAAAALGEQG